MKKRTKAKVRKKRRGREGTCKKEEILIENYTDREKNEEEDKVEEEKARKRTRRKKGRIVRRRRRRKRVVLKGHLCSKIFESCCAFSALVKQR